MGLSGLKRKLIFVWYALRPFHPRTAAGQIIGRIRSLLFRTDGFRVIDLAAGYQCNLNCAHCSAVDLDSDRPCLTQADYAKIIEQAKKIGNLSWNITGGEPLLFDGLDELIRDLSAAGGYVSIQTNCMLLTLKRARELKILGVNCITTSLDSHDPDEHNRFRGDPDSFASVVSGIRNAKKAGLQVLVGGTVTHGNIRSPELEKLIKFVNDLGALFLYNLAVPCGKWSGNKDIVITGEDRLRLKQLLDKYPASSTDHEPGRNGIGCPAGMEKIYITPFGDVLPCPFIHISFGNVKDMPLVDIISRMRQVDQFGSYPEICVAAEDPVFHNRIFPEIEKLRSKGSIVSYYEVFPEIFQGDGNA